jgi:hypothetical protein
MRAWVRTNWGSGARGKRQVLLAGLLALVSFAGLVTAAGLTLRPPTRYVTILEGEDEKGRYLTTLAVAGPTSWHARRVALTAAKKHGLKIVGVAEIEATGPARSSRRSAVLKAPWDKLYIPHEHRCDHPHDQEHPHEH